MPVIGLLGGVACGKSTVAQILQPLGAVVLDADRTGHEVLRIPHIKAAIRSVWGSQVFDSQGEVDRRALGRIVFAGTPEAPAALAQLEQITHPEIGRQILKQISYEMQQKQIRAIVLDAPVMLKAGWNEYCDHILFVDAPEEQRRERALSRGWTSEDFVARENAQEPLDFKKRYATYIIDNSGTLENVRQQVEQFWNTQIAPS